MAAQMKISDEIRAGDALGLVFCDDAARGQAAAARIQSAYVIADDTLSAPQLIKEVIDE